MILAIIYYSFISILMFILIIYTLIAVLLLYLKFIEPIKGICKSNARLDNKLVLVTGGNTGIGLETARDLASRGARVVIACRDEQKSTDAVANIIKTTGNENIEYRYLDLASFKSVRQFAESFKKSYNCLDILINNAGCGGLKHKATEDGIEIVMQVNYLGPFLLTILLLDKIKSSIAGRIIIVSSYGHYIGCISSKNLTGLHTKLKLFKYCNSKLCAVLWMKGLAKRLPPNVTVNAVDPGAVRTDIFKRIIPLLRAWLLMLLRVLDLKTPKEGAQTSIYLAVSEEVAGVSGKYFVDCAEAKYSRVADNDEIVENIWNKSVLLTSQK